MTAQEVVAEARTWLGTRWSHQHRQKGVGADCAGLVLGVGKTLKLADPDVPAYDRMPAKNSLMKYCDQHMYRTLTGPALGRIALMRFGNEPQHLGIFGDYPLGGFSLIHGYVQARKVVEHRFDEIWASRLVAVYILPGVDE